MSKFREYLNEVKKGLSITPKDWDRMIDLAAENKDGDSIAAKIKDKNKAIARYVAGSLIKYGDAKTVLSKRFTAFDEFKKKAIELGATEDEIKKLLTTTKIPSDKLKKYEELKSSGLDYETLRSLSRALLKEGYKISNIKSSNAITQEGKDAMVKNGRIWSIGYTMTIKKDKKEINFVFDALTNEGGGPSKYYTNAYICDIMSSKEFNKKTLEWLDKQFL